MKKLVLAVLVLISFAKVANAQKGSMLLYGNVGFATSRDTFLTKSNSYNINPGFGYQMNDNWTIGINVAIGSSEQEIPESGGLVGSTGNYTKMSFFNIGPFLRYAYPLNDVFSVYGQLEANYLSGSTSPYLLNSVPYTGFGADFFPALGINIKHGFALNLAFGGISYQETTDKGALNSSSKFAVNFGQGATFGISKNFGPKKKK